MLCSGGEIMDMIRRGILLSNVLLLCYCSQLQAGTTETQRTVLGNIARGGDGSGWTSLSSQQLTALGTKAKDYLDNYEAHCIPDGLNVDVRWTNFNRTAIERYKGLGDSAAWTGHYLAAQALQYSVTGNTQILGRINATLDKLNVLTLVTGTDGQLARHAIPISQLQTPSSPYASYYSGYGGTTSDPLLGEKAHYGAEPYSNYAWLGGAWLDTNDGVNFGLATTYKFVNNPAIRAKVSEMSQRITDYLDADGMLYSYPIFAASILRTAATVNPAKYQSTYETWANKVATNSSVDSNFGNYYSNNLDFNRMYLLNELETDPTLKAKWETKLTNMWNDARDHLNAHFAAIYMAGTGNTSDLSAVAALQGELADFPDVPRFSSETVNSTRTDIEFVTVNGDLYAKYALPIEERPPSDFMWQRNPFKLDGSSNSPNEYPGIDVFLPYWMGRQIGAIAVPEPSTVSLLLASSLVILPVLIRRSISGRN